ncbi:hypothetical protein [Mycobacteroides abscessus]|uniref:hypothetical protein n=1 Tax=Mycobacteroides abscessus TaxID=36809 RepID=UPI0012FFE6E0|nr:hypothetical protein [Mycobacteroides abscessus]
MSGRVALPSRDVVISAVDTLLAQGGARPTVTSLAQGFGVAPSTFWRHFPDQAQRIVGYARRRPRTVPGDQLARLAAENRELRAQLDLAAASIMRLTCENLQLTEELQAAQKITSIVRPRRP